VKAIWEIRLLVRVTVPEWVTIKSVVVIVDADNPYGKEAVAVAG
jgi:hypothetical protein